MTRKGPFHGPLLVAMVSARSPSGLRAPVNHAKASCLQHQRCCPRHPGRLRAARAHRIVCDDERDARTIRPSSRWPRRGVVHPSQCARRGAPRDDVRRHHHDDPHTRSRRPIRRYRLRIRQSRRISQGVTVFRCHRRPLRESHRARRVHTGRNDVSPRPQQRSERTARGSPWIRQGAVECRAVKSRQRRRDNTAVHQPRRRRRISRYRGSSRHLHPDVTRRARRRV